MIKKTKLETGCLTRLTCLQTDGRTDGQTDGQPAKPDLGSLCLHSSAHCSPPPPPALVPLHPGPGPHGTAVSRFGQSSALAEQRHTRSTARPCTALTAHPGTELLRAAAMHCARPYRCCEEGRGWEWEGPSPRLQRGSSGQEPATHVSDQSPRLTGRCWEAVAGSWWWPRGLLRNMRCHLCHVI